MNQRLVLTICAVVAFAAALGAVMLVSPGSSSTSMDGAAPAILTVVAIAAIVLACLAFYFLPVVIAGARHHRQVAPILIVNLFFGWTFIGWVAALAWSFSAQRKTA